MVAMEEDPRSLASLSAVVATSTPVVGRPVTQHGCGGRRSLRPDSPMASDSGERPSPSRGWQPAAAGTPACAATPSTGFCSAWCAEHLETFLAEARHRCGGAGLPRFVERELRAFLGCGVMASGFARFRCGGCAREILVAFSCKGRGFCPSCCGRRMAVLAAHLVDGVCPCASGG